MQLVTDLVAGVQLLTDLVASSCYQIVCPLGDLKLNLEFGEGIFRKKVSLLDPFVQVVLPCEELGSLPLQDLVHQSIRRVVAGRHEHTVATLDNVTCFVTMSPIHLVQSKKVIL